MPVKIEDRPIEAVREEVIDQLVMNYSHGKLSFEAFERRLDIAMASESNVEMAQLAEDLDLSVDENYVEQKKQDFSWRYSPEEKLEFDRIINVFSGSTRGGAWRVAKEIQAYSVFASTDIDFTKAVFTQPVVTVKLFSIFSGDTIYIPDNVNVVSKAFCIFGSIDNQTPSHGQKDGPTIVIEGYSIFSGVTIDIKRSLKEKFVEFADSLKGLFS